MQLQKKHFSRLLVGLVAFAVAMSVIVPIVNLQMQRDREFIAKARAVNNARAAKAQAWENSCPPGNVILTLDRGQRVCFRGSAITSIEE